MKVLIDSTVPNAFKYYETYLSEPSLAGDITFAKGDMSSLSDITLELLLGEMAKAGSQGELMIVTHSVPAGFKMNLSADSGSSLKFAGMEIIKQIDEAIAARDAIDKKPSGEQPAAWKAWFDKYEKGIKLPSDFHTNPDWEEFVKQKYDEWYTRQSNTILKFNGVPSFDRFMALWRKVRALNFKRLEFRACRIGTDADAMKKVADFFNAKVVVGPKEARTFFGVQAKLEILSAHKFAAKKKQLSTTVRDFPGISLIIQLIGDKNFQAFATDDAQGKAFIDQFIKKGYTGSVQPFVMGGLEPSGKSKVAGKVHIFPLESEYKKDFLAKHP